jgi:uncharacterized membrane protein
MKNKQLRQLLHYFFQGLIILAPIAITGWAVVSLFNFVDGILPNILYMLFPSTVGTYPDGSPKSYPGFGFILVILIVIGVGYVSSYFLFGRLVYLFDQLLEKTPGIKVIYTTVKDFFEAFAGNKKKFNHPVLVSIERDDVWQLGFITGEDVGDFGLEDHVAVYIPHSYAFSGRLYFVPRSRLKDVTDVSATDAMKFAISGGVTETEHEN